MSTWRACACVFPVVEFITYFGSWVGEEVRVKKHLNGWFLVLVSLFVVVLAGAALASQSSAPAAPSAPVDQANKLLAFLLASGWAGGLWKGAVVGALRSVIGYWSKDPDQQNPETWDWGKLGTAVVAGGVVGLASGLCKMPYDTVAGWGAQLGFTEALYRGLQGLWRRIAKPAATNLVAKAILKKEMMAKMAEPKK